MKVILSQFVHDIKEPANNTQKSLNMIHTRDGQGNSTTIAEIFHLLFCWCQKCCRWLCSDGNFFFFLDKVHFDCHVKLHVCIFLILPVMYIPWPWPHVKVTMKQGSAIQGIQFLLSTTCTITVSPKCESIHLKAKLINLPAHERKSWRSNCLLQDCCSHTNHYKKESFHHASCFLSRLLLKIERLCVTLTFCCTEHFCFTQMPTCVFFSVITISFLCSHACWSSEL